MATTSDDLINLSTALNARALRPDLRVVVRLFDPEFAMRVQKGFGIRFTRSVSHLAAPAFAAAAVGSEVVATVPVGDRRVVLFARLRVPEGSELEGRLARSMDQTGARRVLAVADPGPTMPAGSSPTTRCSTPARRSWSRRPGPDSASCCTSRRRPRPAAAMPPRRGPSEWM